METYFIKQQFMIFCIRKSLTALLCSKDNCFFK